MNAPSDADLTESNLKGKAQMPMFEGKLTTDEIEAAVRYVRTFRDVK